MCLLASGEAVAFAIHLQDMDGTAWASAFISRDRFTFALLDDMVISVDAGRRYQFCKLLKTHFPDTREKTLDAVVRIAWKH